MSMNPYLAQILVEERIKSALREAEQARLVKMTQKTKGTRPFLPSIMQRLSDWWDGGNGRHQLTTEKRRI